MNKKHPTLAGFFMGLGILTVCACPSMTLDALVGLPLLIVGVFLTGELIDDEFRKY